MSILRVGVVGLGYWGPVLAKNFVTHPRTRLAAVADLDGAKLEACRTQFKDTVLCTDYRDMFPHVDAVVIAVPVSAHFPVALECIKAGKHVLIEKPMTATSEEAEILVAEAEKHKVIIAVDHLLLFMGMVRKVREIIKSGELGDLNYYNSIRANLGAFQQDVDVIWDLGAHDLSQMVYLLGETDGEIRATGSSHYCGGKIDDAYLHVRYPGSFIASMYVSWLCPFRNRMAVVGGTKKSLVFSDLWAGEEIKLYDRHVECTRSGDMFKYKYFRGGIVVPVAPGGEPLKLEIDEFAAAILDGAPLTSDGKMGLLIVRMLEKCSKSL